MLFRSIERFLLVSTDKAVNPSTVMGLSKKICELLIKLESFKSTKISYSIVRFGNVVGSSGSVFPKFIDIVKNNEIINKIEELERHIEAKEVKKTNQESDNKKEYARESGRLCEESMKLADDINKLRKEIRLISLDPMYSPNTRPHQQIWAPQGIVRENAFLSNIDEIMVKKIMGLNIDNNLKVLLLLGIGMFVDNQEQNIH